MPSPEIRRSVVPAGALRAPGGRRENRMKTAEKPAWTRIPIMMAALALLADGAIAQTSCAGEWTPDVSPRNGVIEFSPVSGLVHALE
jgi:hypothetical protein